MTSHNNPATMRYQQALAALPCPGSGFHAGLMRPANLGRLAGLSAAVVESDIERAARPGTRLIRPGEIREAVAKAFSSPQQPYAHGAARAGCARSPQRSGKRIQQESARLRAKITADGGGQVTPEDVVAASPLPVATWPVHEHSWRLLEALYAPDEHLYIGGLDEGPSRQAKHVMPASEWAERVEGTLYREILVPLGVDSACRNESRFSRMPGVMRPETGRWQKLLWLCPRGEVIP